MTITKRAIDFLEAANRPVELAWARAIAGLGGPEEVERALTRHQNDDGGFGKQLEVDIKAGASQPFAARLALLTMLGAGVPAASPVARRLESWLETNQDDDGCWVLPAEVLSAPIAPWFAGWTFPSLNPALDIAAAARRLGIGSTSLHGRVDALFARLASLEEIAIASFYTLLPYAEYVPWAARSIQERWLLPAVARIAEIARSDGYEDAGHFFEHLGPAGGPIANLIDTDIIEHQLARLGEEQQADGGWPTPYDQGWRPWATASAVATLADFERSPINRSRRG